MFYKVKENENYKIKFFVKENKNSKIELSDQNLMVDVIKFRTLVAYKKRHRQTVQTQIRLLLKKQSDQGLPFAILTIIIVNSRPDNQHFI